MSTIAVSNPRRVLADAITSSRTADAVLVVSGAAFVGLLAQVTIHLGFTPVPITGQTLGVLLVGTALGWRRASLAMALYVVAGVVGVPWFAGHSSGVPMATFGYLLGFVVASAVLGWLASRGADRTVARAVSSMVIGEVIIFAIAVPWLAFSLHVGLATAISYGLTPFITGEVIKASVAGVALPATWRLVDRTRR